MVHPPRGRVPTSVRFHYAHGFNAQTLAQMLDSLVRVSRRVACDHYASILEVAVLSSGGPHGAAGYNTPRGGPHSRRLCPAARADAGPPAPEYTPASRG